MLDRVARGERAAEGMAEQNKLLWQMERLDDTFKVGNQLGYRVAAARTIG